MEMEKVDLSYISEDVPTITHMMEKVTDWYTNQESTITHAEAKNMMEK